MKRINRIVVVIGFIIVSSCSKEFLDLNPNLTTTSLTYFKTEHDFTEALNGLYATLQTQASTYVLLNELRSDNTCVYFNPSERAGVVLLEEIDEFRDGAINTSSNYWNAAYHAVYRINLVLSKIDGFAFTTNGLKERMTGECKFLRAFYYFNLVRFYGSVPLVLTPVENLSDAYTTGRTSSEDLYKQIIEDVGVAVSALPDTYSSSDVGRITKGAALMLLAKIQMTQKKFSDAVNTLKSITALGYTLQPDYQNCFNPAFKNNSESVFEIQYNAAIDGMSNNNIFSWVPIGSEAYNAIFGYTGSNRTGWNIPTKDLIAAYEPGDLRKDISLKTGYTNSLGNFVHSPYINKWIYDAGVADRNDCNFPIYRYADVLLMLAEALNEVQYVSGGEAFDLLNGIRHRAGIADKTPLDLPDQQSFRMAVEKERRVELAFEGHRWPDLVRTERAIDVIRAYGVIEKADPSTPRGLGEDYVSGAFDIQPFRMVYPVPQVEIEKAPRGLTQNDGY